jgi:hypothetical protein
MVSKYVDDGQGEVLDIESTSELSALPAVLQKKSRKWKLPKFEFEIDWSGSGNEFADGINAFCMGLALMLGVAMLVLHCAK